jgi:MarR-like DNA-binding transcriptional regulator SgrR of sgrS sRNA
MRALFLFFNLIFYTNQANAVNILRVSSQPNLPLDPLSIQTMADYDLALCLYKNWFNYDLKRKAVPGVIKSWEFKQLEGKYYFHIDPAVKWSDGSPLTSKQLLLNLRRIIETNTSYGKAINGLIEIDNSNPINNETFTLKMKNNRPSEAFFQRMGSIFLAITHPKDWQKNKLVSNNFSLGNYKIKKLTTETLSLDRNTNMTPIKNSFDEIVINRKEKNPSLEKFLNGETTEDIIQTNSLIEPAIFNRIVEKKFPFWIRAFDRVSYLAPIKSFEKNDESIRVFLRLLGSQLSNKPLAMHKFAKLAKSLQPIGYPLFSEINYLSRKGDQELLPSKISILTFESPQLKIQQQIIEEQVRQIKNDLKVEWKITKTIADFLSNANNSSQYDLKLLSFGVADPEPATWLSLLINREKPFFELSEKDIQKFEKIISKHNDKKSETNALKELLLKIGERGSYLPLFHFSTLSIAKPGINFKNIHELDETVDYGKLIKD